MTADSRNDAFVLLKNAMKKRGFDLDFDHYEALISQKRKLQVATEDFQNQRNVVSKQIGKQKALGEDTQVLMEQIGQIKQDLETTKQQYEHVAEEIHNIELGLPNPLADDVPHGASDSDNLVVKTWSKPSTFDFQVKDHADLGEQLKQLNFSQAATVAQSRFVYLQGPLATLHRALVQFMLNLHLHEHGYQEVNVPLLVNQQSLVHTGQLPKFADDLFFLDNKKLALIPTAEVSLVNLFAQQTLDESMLPIKMVAHSNCFRSEAGSYGQDTKGMIRQHQFEKVELVQFTKAEDSFAALDEICMQAEKILQLLELPYQKILKCSGDTGFTACKTYDLEVWLPSQNCYREISSISNCLDFQAKRMKTRYKNKTTKKKTWVHTLNGSGLAVGRTLVAIIENYQTKEGTVRIPKVLKPFMGSMDEITIV